MGEIWELTREFGERLGVAEDGSSGPMSGTTDTAEMGQAHLSSPTPAQEPVTPPRFGDGPATTTASTTPALPPHMTQNPSTLLSTISQTPLFMTSLSPSTEPNPGLEALQVLAYEGLPWEVAQNFREQGNEYFRARRWGDAREFYGKALGVLGEARGKREKGEGREEVEGEGGEDRTKEREIEEICLVNRAACNLELKNYRQTTLDSTQALSLNPSNIKAHYRLSLAHFHLNHLSTALSTTLHALTLSPTNPSLLSLHQKIQAAQSRLASQEKARLARAAALKAAYTKLQTTLNNRNIVTRTTATKPLLPDPNAMIVLGDEDNRLYFPTLILYPLTLQSDFISALGEHELLGQRLLEMLPPPWDEGREYTPDGVECYMETIAGGLVKVGKKVPVGKVLGSGKVEVVDEVVRMLVVPRVKAVGWVEEFKEAKKRR